MDKIAKKLLEIKAIFLRPDNFFTFTSGVKSPIYCDNRLVLSYPKTRTLIADELAKLVKEKYPNVEMIMGVATAGISHAALVAERLNLPAGYVRGTTKKHGRVNQVEGKCDKGIKVVIIEDLISTGKSIIEAKNALEKVDADILGAVAIFTYGLPSVIDKFVSQNLSFYTLTNFDSLIKIAVLENYITTNEEKILQEWKIKFNNDNV